MIRADRDDVNARSVMLSAMSFASHLTSREYHEGAPLTNRLGLQLARTLVMNALVKHACRRRPPSRHAAYDRLMRDGVVAIPNYLPPEIFQAVSEEYAAARAAGLLTTAPCVEDNGVIEDVVAVGKNREHFPVTYRTLAGDQSLRELVGDVIGQTPSSTALVISVMRQSPVPTTPARLVGANYIHADAHFPTLKAWLYLNDIDESNGAFTYAPGSHRVSWGRLAYEYEASIRVARAKHNGAVHTTIPYGLARMPRPDQLRKMGIQERAMVGKANTLIIANTMGFHRRGTFQPEVTRDMLALRFGDRRSKTPKAPGPKP